MTPLHPRPVFPSASIRVHLRLNIFVLPVLSLFLSACNSAISPGYRIEKLDVEVRFVPSPHQSLHFRAAYRLKNISNSPLDFLEAKLPSESSFNRRHLLISLDGQPVPPTISADTARIPFSSPWPVKSTRSLVIEYDLLHPQPLIKDAFYLLPNNWYPALLPPDHLLARADLPDQWDLRIRVPDGFLVHASGQPRGSSRSGSERIHRFTQRPTDDFHPYVVSGRYNESVIRQQSLTVHFWALMPVPAADAELAARNIAAVLRAYEDILGPLDRRPRPLFVLNEAPATVAHFSRDRTIGSGIILNPPLFTVPPANPSRLCEVDQLLSDLWFQELTAPHERAKPLMEPLKLFTLLLASPSCVPRLYGAAAQPQLTQRFLQGYLESQKAARGTSDHPDAYFEDQANELKRLLFAFALEEKIGRDAFARGLRRMVQARRGLDWSIDDLRSALELESGQNLAEFFRVWLYQPGIPDDFRRRYALP